MYYTKGFKITIGTKNNWISDAWDWSYRLKSKVISPRIFQYFARDDQNLMECTCSMKVNGYSLDQVHTLQIVSEDGTTDLYEFRWVSNNEKIGNFFLDFQKFTLYYIVSI